jgi:hypothetical protein
LEKNRKNNTDSQKNFITSHKIPYLFYGGWRGGEGKGFFKSTRNAWKIMQEKHKELSKT